MPKFFCDLVQFCQGSNFVSFYNLQLQVQPVHLTVRLARHDWRIWGGLQNVLLCNGISGSRFDLRTLISETSFRWRDILFLSYMNFESINDGLGFEILLHGGFLLDWASW